MHVRTVAALLAVAVFVAVVFVTAADYYGAFRPCIADDGEPCASAATMRDVEARLDVIRAERTGGRFDTSSDLLAECSRTNGAPLTVEACSNYLAEGAAVAAECGDIAAQHAYEVCEAATLAAYRSVQR
jgi:hypothetical protein